MSQHNFGVTTKGLSRGVGFVSRHSPCVVTVGRGQAR